MASTPEHNIADNAWKQSFYKGGPEASGSPSTGKGSLSSMAFMGSVTSPWYSNPHSPPGNVPAMEIIPTSLIPMEKPKEEAKRVFLWF